MGRYLPGRKNLALLFFLFAFAWGLFASDARFDTMKPVRIPYEYFSRRIIKAKEPRSHFIHPALYTFYRHVAREEVLDVMAYWQNSPQKQLEMSIMLDRASYYMSFVHRKIREYGIPPEFAYLPLVESSYDPMAVSSSGAVGLWQFMANSYAEFGLHVDYWLDERRDFWKETEAALAKLKYNYDKLGDWVLALSAYHIGLGRMQRTIEEFGESDYWKLSDMGGLPEHDRNYIVKFLALSALAMYPLRYGIEPAEDFPLKWEQIELTSALNLKSLAEMIPLSYEDIKEANPELNFPVTPPISYHYSLKVPDYAALFIKEVLESIRIPVISFQLYFVREDETLTTIAEDHSLTLATLAEANRDLDPHNLKVGSVVFIPLYNDSVPVVPEELEEDYLIDRYVKEGESLWSLAEEYQVLPEVLAIKNHLPVDYNLKKGMKLKVPQ